MVTMWHGSSAARGSAAHPTVPVNQQDIQTGDSATGVGDDVEFGEGADLFAVDAGLARIQKRFHGLQPELLADAVQPGRTGRGRHLAAHHCWPRHDCGFCSWRRRSGVMPGRARPDLQELAPRGPRIFAQSCIEFYAQTWRTWK